MAVVISLNLSESEVDILNNTSKVTAKLTVKWTGGSYNLNNKSGYIIIDGAKYTFSEPFNTGQSASGSSILCTKSRITAHNEDGSKTAEVSASYNSGVSSGSVKDSKKIVLTQINRGLKIKSGGSYKRALVYVKSGGSYKSALPYVKSNGSYKIGVG